MMLIDIYNEYFANDIDLQLIFSVSLNSRFNKFHIKIKYKNYIQFSIEFKVDRSTSDANIIKIHIINYNATYYLYFRVIAAI